MMAHPAPLLPTALTSLTIIVKTCVAEASLKGREVNWNTSDLWQNLRYFLEVGSMGM